MTQMSTWEVLNTSDLTAITQGEGGRISEQSSL